MLTDAEEIFVWAKWTRQCQPVESGRKGFKFRIKMSCINSDTIVFFLIFWVVVFSLTALQGNNQNQYQDKGNRFFWSQVHIQ